MDWIWKLRNDGRMYFDYLEPEYVGKCVDDEIPKDLKTLFEQISIQRFSCICNFVHFDFADESDAAIFMEHMKQSLNGTPFDENEIELTKHHDVNGNEYSSIHMPLIYMFFTIFTIKE